MVKEIQKDNQTLYQCDVCKFFYKDKSWANKCEKWCKETHSCNTEIITHSIKINGEKDEESKNRN